MRRAVGAVEPGVSRGLKHFRERAFRKSPRRSQSSFPRMRESKYTMQLGPRFRGEDGHGHGREREADGHRPVGESSMRYRAVAFAQTILRRTVSGTPAKFLSIQA